MIGGMRSAVGICREPYVKSCCDCGADLNPVYLTAGIHHTRGTSRAARWILNGGVR